MKTKHQLINAIIAAALLTWGFRSEAAPVKVEAVKTTAGWQLKRGGEVYFIKGAGGSDALELLKSSGANSLRTWRADEAGSLLDRAEKLGLTVTVGIELRHERHGFNYSDPQQVAAQLATIRQTVSRFKDHPALLMWGIGNEVEGNGDGTNTFIWSAINSAAKLVKQLDPNHPTMAVIAEVGGNRVNALNSLCPEIDVVGINSYAGASSVGKRYLGQHGAKPYVITEFGPPGAWETGKTPWGAPLEPTSAEKADWYRRAYLGSIQQQSACLGSYVFLWGHKEETTPTWYGMLLPNGSKLQAVDTMIELWSGKPTSEPCPLIKSLKIQGDDQIVSEMIFNVVLETSDPAGKPLTIRWVLQPEQTQIGVGGDKEPELPVLKKEILMSNERLAVVSAPSKPGAYRLYAYAENGGRAAVANVPFLVTPKKGTDCPKATFPFWVSMRKTAPPTITSQPVSWGKPLPSRPIPPVASNPAVAPLVFGLNTRPAMNGAALRGRIPPTAGAMRPEAGT